MSDIGDLSVLLPEVGDEEETTTVPDFTWLYPDIDEYRKDQALPRQNLDSIPELEEQWGYLSDEARFRLSPENREPSRPNTPFWSERHVVNLNDDSALAGLVAFLRQQLQNGKTASSALQAVGRKFPVETIRSFRENIKAVLKSESGLLGDVYVDSEFFPKCASGEGQDLVRKKNSTAQYVLAKDSCSSCRWATDAGKCSRFDKTLVFDVDHIDFNEALWNFYKSKAQALDKDLEKAASAGTYKDRIRLANLAPVKEAAPALDGKPVQRDVTKDITVEAAQKGLRDAVVEQEVVGNLALQKKLRKFALRMHLEPHGPQIKQALASDPDLEGFKPHLHLLGNLYADLSCFEETKEARAFLDANPGVIPFGSPASKVASEIAMPDLKSADLLSQIVYRYALQKYGYDYDKSVTAKVANHLYKASDEKVLKFAKAVYSKPLPQKVKKYDHLALVIYDPTEGVTAEYAERTLREAKVSHQVIVDPRIGRTRKALSLRMALGKHTKELRQRIAAEGHHDLLAHWKLHGFEYLLTDGFSTKDLILLERKRSALKNLPKVSSEDLQGFLTSPEFKDKVASRYASLRKDRPGRKVMASLRQKISSMDASGILDLASIVYSQPLPNRIASYQAYGQDYDPTGGLTSAEAQELFSKAEDNRPQQALASLRRKLQARILQGDTGPALQLLLADSQLSDLDQHLGYAGVDYLPAGFFASEEDARKVASLRNLPLISDGENPFDRDDVLLKVAARYRSLGYSFTKDQLTALPSDKRSHLLRALARKQVETFEMSKDFVLEIGKKLASEGQTLLEIESGKQGDVGSVSLGEKADRDLRANAAALQTGTAPTVVAHNLPSYVKHGGETGKRLVALLKAHFGKDVVKAAFLPSAMPSESVRTAMVHKAAKEQVLAKVLSQDFQPAGVSSAILPAFFQTKIGRWLRDEIAKGAHGSGLSNKLATNFSSEELFAYAPLILALREEEGLMGRTYVDASSYQDCKVGKRVLKPTVTQVKKASKCSGCTYNREGFCNLYARDLVAKESYGPEEFRAVLKQRIASGELRTEDAEVLFALEFDWKTKTRLAHLKESEAGPRISSSPYKGHYGDPVETGKAEKKVIALLQDAKKMFSEGLTKESAEKLLVETYGSQTMRLARVHFDTVHDRVTFKMADHVNQEHVNAPTGVQQMISTGLTRSNVFDELKDLKEAPEVKMLDGIKFLGQ